MADEPIANAPDSGTGGELLVTPSVLFLNVLEAQTYIQYGYLLTLSSLLILAGALSDVYGRRRMFMIGLIGFGGASALCGLAPNLEFLVVARLVQGGPDDLMRILLRHAGLLGDDFDQFFLVHSPNPLSQM